MKLICLVASLIGALTWGTTAKAENYFCTKKLDSLPILQNGRIKPLYVHASETLKNLTGSSKYDKLSAVETYCLLSSKRLGLPSTINLVSKIEHVELQKFLRVEEQKKIDYESLLTQFDALNMEMRSIKNNESYQKAISKLLNNILLYNDILNGENWKVYSPQTSLQANKELALSESFQSFAEYFTEDKVIAQKNVTPLDPFGPILERTKNEFIRDHGDHYLIELTYAKLNLVSYSLMVTCLALASFVLLRNYFKVTLALSFLTLIMQIVLMTLRILVSQRAPITNMYETVMFSGSFALLMSLILGHLKQANLLVFFGLIYNFLSLMMLNFANGMLSATIGPLVPVLRDNFWLSTHVTTVIASYGAFALSWILSNYVLIKKKWFKHLYQIKEEQEIVQLNYTTLKWGTVTLALGIILGGVWADYSWGRFWGWDPKETWSLIVLCIYMAILHGRYTSWIKNDRFITFTAAAFLSVMMAWFGVNYILATGLHSYGFSEGGAIFLGSFFAIQIAIIILTYKKEKITTA